MDQEYDLTIFPSKVTSFEDITTINSLLAEAILNLQKANEKNVFIKVLMNETIKTVSGAVTLLQSYNLSFNIDNLISKVTDILMLANDSSKDAKVIVVKSLTEKFIDLLICQTFKLLHKLEILKTLNIVLQSCPATAKQKLLVNSAFTAKLKFLINCLKDVGDYEFQVCIIEFFFRLVPKDQRADFMEKSFNDEIFCSELLNIRDSRFETDCRYFLNKQNAKGKKISNRIYTIPAVCVKIDGTKIYKPSDEGYDEFWVDFNTGSKRIGIFCEPNFLSSQQSQDEELWETLSIWSRDVKTFSYSAKNKLKTATIELLPGAQMLGNRRDGQSHLVVISASQEYELLKALDSTLKKEFKASSVDEPIKINVRDQHKSETFQKVDKALTDISSSSVTSSFAKSKVSIPINLMTTPAHSVIISDYDTSPALQLMHKKINQDGPTELQIKSNLQTAITEATNKLQSENEIVNSNNESKCFDTSNNKKVYNSTTPKKTTKLIKKTKTPIVFVKPEVKKSKEIFNEESLSDKMYEQKPVNKIENELLPDKQSENQHLMNKKAHVTIAESEESATERKGKYKRSKETKLKTSSINEINVTHNRRKTISPGNLSLDDFKLTKPCKTMTFKKIQDQYAMSKKQQNNKSDMASKASEKYKNKENINTEIDNVSLWKNFPSNSKTTIQIIDQVDNNFKIGNNKLQAENKYDESPKICNNSNYSQFIDFHGKCNESKKDLDDIIADTQTTSNLINNMDEKRKTESSSHLMQADKKLVHSNNKTKNVLCTNVYKMKGKKCTNLKKTAEFPPKAAVQNSFIFKKSEIPKDKDSPFFLDKSKDQHKKYVTLQKEDIKNTVKPDHSRNLRERKKAISYKECYSEHNSFSEKENKSKIESTKQKPIDVKKTSLKSMKDCIPSPISPPNNYSYMRTQKETNNYVSLDSGEKIKKPLCQGLWTRQKVEKTVTTMSFSGLLPKDISSDPYDFDLECSLMSGRSSLLPFHSNEITESSKKSVHIRNKKSLKQINKSDKKNKTIKTLINPESKQSVIVPKVHVPTALNKSTINAPLKDKVKKKCNNTDPDNKFTSAYIVMAHGFESDPESSKSPLVDYSEKMCSQNQGLIFPHLEDSIPCTPCPDDQESPDPSLNYTVTATGSEVSWIRRPLKENQNKHVKTYKTKNHKVSPNIKTSKQNNQPKDISHLYKKENNSISNRLDKKKKVPSFSCESKNNSKKVPESYGSWQSSNSMFQNLDPAEPQTKVDEKTWSIISSQINYHIKGALNKSKPFLKDYVSPLDVTFSMNSGPSSTARPTKSALKRKYSSISSDSCSVASKTELNELSDDIMSESLKFKPKKLFKTDHSPIHSECTNFPCFTSQDKSLSETSNIEQAPKDTDKHFDNRNIKTDKPKAPSSFSVTNDKETETGKSFVGFKFFSPYTQSSENVRHNKKEDKLLSEELGLSPSTLSEISSLNLSCYSPLTSKVICKSKEPKPLLNKMEKRAKHSLAQVSQHGSEHSEHSKLKLIDQCEVNHSERGFQGSFVRKNIKLPKSDDDFQNILRSTCKFLHSKLGLEQNESVVAVDQFQDLVQTCVAHLNTNLEELTKTEQNVSVLWEQARENFKKHRLSQITELKRLILAQKALEQSLFQNQHCEKSGQKKFLAALKKDMNAIQKKILFQINENSLMAIRQCLQHSAMLS